MHIPPDACCIDGLDNEEKPVFGRAFLTVLSVLGAVGYLAYALTALRL
jgi:hypothetical protein